MFDFRRRNNGVNEIPDQVISENGNGHLIHLRGVDKTYESAAGSFLALKDVHLNVDSGEFVAVVGKSGSGKSTLINMITGIDHPSAGAVRVAGAEVHAMSERKLAGWRGRNIGIIFQFFQLLPTLTVIENVMLPMDFCHMYARRERKQQAMQLLEQVDVAEHAYKLPSAVSGGQQQRIAIARALANDPPILIADEPTGNLDSRTAEAVYSLFERQVAEGKTILMVTHDKDITRRVTRTLILSDGEIVEEHLARALPELSNKQLVEATRNGESQRFAPGSIILQEGHPAERFYLITRGRVEVLVEDANGGQVLASEIKRGEYFGEIELLNGGINVATVRAAQDAGTEVITLERGTLQQLLLESEATRSDLNRIAEQRLAENQASRRR